MSLNLFIASGNLGKDMEVRFTPNGKCIGTFSLPVKSGWGDNEKTSWVRCKVLGDRAEKIAPYLLKGSKVTVTGSFVLEEWDSNGVQKSMPCVIVNEIDLPPKSDAQPAQRPAPTPPKPPAQQQQPANNAVVYFDDDIPF